MEQTPDRWGEASQSRRDSSFRLWITPILLLGFALRMLGLGGFDLWVDEAISIFHARQGIADILAMSSARAWEHPPGYYILLHFWVKLFGESEWALRFFSVLGGMVVIALLAVVARRWFGSRLAWLAALLMAVNPWAVQYSRDARMYAWLWAASLLGVYLLDRALTSDRPRDWGLFALVLVFSSTLHYLFGLVLVAYVLFLILRWRRLPASRTRLALVLGTLLAAAFLAVVGREGSRSSLILLLQDRLREPTRFAPVDAIFGNWALGLPEETLARGIVAIGTVSIWALIVLGIIGMPQPQRWSRRNLQWLMGLLVFAPLLLAFPIFIYANGRHVSAMFGLSMLAIALGIYALYCRQRLLGVAALSVLLVLSGVLSFRQMNNRWRPFSRPVDYISSRAGDNDRLVYTYFFDWPQSEYYNRRGLATAYIPEIPGPISDAALDEKVAGLLAEGQPVWLNLYPGPAETGQVERAFDRLAYPASKTWFGSDRGIVHYFAAVSLQDQDGGLSWDEGLRLQRWRRSSDSLEAGDALRLEFDWQRTRPLERVALVSLSLIGADGQTWASRVSEPCNGSCPLPGWGDEIVRERAAFYIPPDTPPGAYELRIGWLTEDGQPLLGRIPGAEVAEVTLPLTTVEVRPPTSPSAARAAPLGESRYEQAAPGLELVSVAPFKPVTRAGADLLLPMQLAVSGVQPALDLRLHLSPVRSSGSPGAAVEITAPAGPAWHPSDQWIPGTTVRVQPRFRVPGNLAPGEYVLSVGIASIGQPEPPARISLGTVTVEDRPRAFDVPEMGQLVDASWNEGVRLARVAAPNAVQAGQPAEIGLVWQSEGPAARNWKVFLHLIDDQGVTHAQVDAYPAQGGAPTNSWQAGEVILDQRMLDVPADLAPGDYAVRVGLYDEQTGERLSMTGGADSYVLPFRLKVTRP